MTGKAIGLGHWHICTGLANPIGTLTGWIESKDCRAKRAGVDPLSTLFSMGLFLAHGWFYWMDRYLFVAHLCSLATHFHSVWIFEPVYCVHMDHIEPLEHAAIVLLRVVLGRGFKSVLLCLSIFM